MLPLNNSGELRGRGPPRMIPLNTSWEDAVARADLDLLQGTLDLLILKTLTWGPKHGYSEVGSMPNGASPKTIAKPSFTS